ncbi:TPA: hypothetical protein QCY38_005819 [Bacillus toyonensis]|uniref:hypothetical protein n=1 Tax=Bacillus toyonensis TaxID=155322 RepID=UPI0002E94371|nr:hypothetical protein [Bacillus toyonensis]QQN81599.1 hypothetical protein I0K03_15195 [Bacillus toyonensis]HDR7952011.1 hypothetical protein [Bacillus toyonensis]
MNLCYYKKDDGNLTKSISSIILDHLYCYQSLNGAEFLFYPAVTLPPQNLVKTKKLGGGSTARNSPIGEG